MCGRVLWSDVHHIVVFSKQFMSIFHQVTILVKAILQGVVWFWVVKHVRFVLLGIHVVVFSQGVSFEIATQV